MRPATHRTTQIKNEKENINEKKVYILLQKTIINYANNDNKYIIGAY